MSEEVLATERLERSISRLEEVVAERIAAAERVATERVAALEVEIEALKTQLLSLKAEKETITSALDDRNIEYRVLENVTDTVRDRLDETIGRLREALSA